MGIEAMKPGYKHIFFQPHTSNKLDYSKATYESMYGTIASGWERKNGKVIITVKVPANTKTAIVVPVDDASKVTVNGTQIGKNEEIIVLSDGYGNKMIEILKGSGDYFFEYLK
ncbi:MAG: hypothetical protein MUF36_04110 [Bacteroidales bacterium]|nr:hypothetical protein [Bacteroidales bacterium]